MKKVALVLAFLIANLFALETMSPTAQFKATGAVQDMYFKDNKLYAATDNGTIEVFDTNTNEKIKTIEIPKIKDFMGDTIPSKIYSIDIINDKILFVAQGMKGYRNLFVYENEKLNKVLDIEKKMYLQKAFLIDDTRAIIGLLSNQIGLYDIVDKKTLFLNQISTSSFSHFMISEDKKSIATTDESGIIRVLNVENGSIINQPKALNLDRVYQLDYKNGKILTAGQDRKAVLYDQNTSYALSFDFLLYSCALSPKGKLGAIAYNEENEILVFNTENREYIYNLKGHDATLTKILFINDKELFSSSDSKIINYWRLK